MNAYRCPSRRATSAASWERLLMSSFWNTWIGDFRRSGER